MATSFTKVYNAFLDQITDDMQVELTPEDTMKDLQSLLIHGIPQFEFPRKVLSYTIDTETIEEKDLTEDDFVIGIIWNELEEESGGEPTIAQVVVERSTFDADLTSEEIFILALIMKCGWLQRQVTSIENTRMKYSGSDFKFTSQANHLAKLLTLLTECQRQSFHFQRLYKRRKIADDGTISSNWGILRETSALDD